MITQVKRSLVTPFSEPPSSLPDNAAGFAIKIYLELGHLHHFYPGMRRASPWPYPELTASILITKNLGQAMSPLCSNLPVALTSQVPRNLCFLSSAPTSSHPPIQLHGPHCSSDTPCTVQPQGLCTCCVPTPNVLIYSLLEVTSTSPALCSPEFYKLYSWE